MKRAIIIMAKVPVAGTVKTRLQPFLTPEQCAELAAAFLQDAENKAKTICKKIILAYSPANERDALENILQTKNILVEQKGDNLGERMSNAFKFAFGRGSDAVVMIGTDSPAFAAEFIEQAFEFLETDSDLVLGKAADGGFYSIGLRKFVPRLFDGVAWSTDSVYEQIVKNAERLGLGKLSVLPRCYDVDTPDDFFVLRDEMLVVTEIQKRAPATYQWLLLHPELFG
ncbi:MAG: TIGR04282 family arsenosugar biosynthesis glycosyltransferase [Acidobacteria bacterium]|nr:TIGR04282 family arsenosugar biosynthesis glycosyltransferase [Acidobacteriota bacterium]MCA1639821.1 TIGR04282 family arsenosugar biosynthesis glycosyltransferase [Acidobacteriota bacterium]